MNDLQRKHEWGKVLFQRLQHRHTIMKARCYLKETHDRSCVKNATGEVHRTPQPTDREPKFAVVENEGVRGDWGEEAGSPFGDGINVGS